MEWEALRTKVSWLPFVLRCFPICPDDSIGTPRFAGSPKRSYLLFVAFVFFVVLSFIRVICAFRERGTRAKESLCGLFPWEDD